MRKPCRCGQQNKEISVGAEVWVKGTKSHKMILGIVNQNIRGRVTAVTGQHYQVLVKEPVEAILHLTRDRLVPI